MNVIGNNSIANQVASVLKNDGTHTHIHPSVYHSVCLYINHKIVHLLFKIFGCSFFKNAYFRVLRKRSKFEYSEFSIIC